MMKNIRSFLLLTLVTLLVGALGCTDQQLASIDHAVTDANTAAHGISAVAQGPAGAILPPQVRIIMELLGIGATAALGIWKWLQASGLLKKNQDLVMTLKAVCDGVSASGKKADPVKAQIKQIMLDREVYSTANPIVDSVKTKNS